MQVARFVARGMSNREIAAALVISPRTAEDTSSEFSASEVSALARISTPTTADSPDPPTRKSNHPTERETMRAAVHIAPGTPMLIEELEPRQPGPGEVLVSIDAAAVCLTDVLGADGLTLVDTPFIGGHSGTGVVTAVGDGVTRIRVGDRIVTAGSAECGRCYACVRGTPSACDDIFGGMIPPRTAGTRSDGSAVHADGGVGVFAEQAVLRESVLAALDPEDAEALPPEHAAMLGCGIISGLGAVLRVADVPRGATVAIVGCGHLGLWMIQGARLAGAERIIAIEPIAYRRDLARALGATDLVDPAQADPADEVRALTAGRGADVAFEAGGTTAGTELVIGLVRGGGTVVLTSMAQPTDTVTFPALDIGVSGKRILSSQSGGGHLRRDLPLFARLLRTGQIDAAPLMSATYPLVEIDRAFAAARAREVVTGVLLPQT
jgi:S-(hydroxymethyl)glutathione dehydrogenase/alcohol dehydrogenase